MSAEMIFGLWLVKWATGLTIGTALLYKLGMPALRYMADINLIRRQG